MSREAAPATSSKGDIIMKRTIAASFLILVAASAALASGNGKISVTYHGTGKAFLDAYDWDDFVATAPNTSASLTNGQQATLTCKKGALDPNAPGCKLEIGVVQDGRNTLVKDKERVDNGSYELNGTSFVRAIGTEVSVAPMHLPAPGGGTTDCVNTAPGGTILDNGKLHLLWQNDGNLVLYRNDGGGPVWGSDTVSNATRLCFQGDGNLVVYNGPTPTWATGTNGTGAALKLRQDCNLVIESPGGVPVWSTGTHCY
jgi:hypothetical protein